MPICAECLRNVIITNALAAASATGIAWLFWRLFQSPVLLTGLAIVTAGVIVLEFIRALRWHRHD